MNSLTHCSQSKTQLHTDLYLIFVWPGRSRLEYCLDRALKSPSPLPLPPLAGSNVGLAAVVIFDGSAVAKRVGKKHKMKTKKCSKQHTPSSWHKHNVTLWITKQQCRPFSLTRIFYTDIYMFTQERLWGLVNHHIWYISTYMILLLQSDRDNDFCCWIFHLKHESIFIIGSYIKWWKKLQQSSTTSNKLNMSQSVLDDLGKNCYIPVIIIISLWETYPLLLGEYSIFLVLIKYKTQGSQLAIVAKLLTG